MTDLLTDDRAVLSSSGVGAMLQSVSGWQLFMQQSSLPLSATRDNEWQATGLQSSGAATGLQSAGAATGLSAGAATGLSAGAATGLSAGAATGLIAGVATAHAAEMESGFASQSGCTSTPCPHSFTLWCGECKHTLNVVLKALFPYAALNKCR